MSAPSTGRLTPLLARLTLWPFTGDPFPVFEPVVFDPPAGLTAPLGPVEGVAPPVLPVFDLEPVDFVLPVQFSGEPTFWHADG